MSGTGFVLSTGSVPIPATSPGCWRALEEWTHKSSNGSSLPRGHSSKGDHQEDDNGAETPEEVLGSQRQREEGLEEARRDHYLEISQTSQLSLSGPQISNS